MAAEDDTQNTKGFSKPKVAIFLILLAVYLFIYTYFQTEIITRKDFDLTTKASWQVTNLFFPVIGNIGYMIFGKRHMATF